MGNAPLFCCREAEAMKSEKGGPIPPPARKVSAPTEDLIRIFLLGDGEVGKSTLIKQIQKLCHTSQRAYQMYDENWDFVIPFDEYERRNQKPKVHQNIFRIIGTLIFQAQSMGMRFDNPWHQQQAETLMDYIGDLDQLIRADVILTPERAEMIKTLWNQDHGAIGGAWAQRRKFLLSDSALYFLKSEKLDEVASPHYVPSIDDLLRVRDPTTNMGDYNFSINRVKFQLRDMGGQPVEREKFIMYMRQWLKNTRPNDRNFILYVAALSDYNQKHIDDQHQDKTKLDESIDLLTVFLSLQDLKHCGFILFLNKEDIFKQKLEQFNDFNDYFQPLLGDFSDRRLTVKQAEEIVARRFSEAIQDQMGTRDTIYCRFTNATDSKMMEGIFAAVRADIVQDLIKCSPWHPFP